jgi:hypothetical protein
VRRLFEILAFVSLSWFIVRRARRRTADFVQMPTRLSITAWARTMQVTNQMDIWKSTMQMLSQLTLLLPRKYRKDLVNKASSRWYWGSSGDFNECFITCTHVLWAKTAYQNNASTKSNGHLEKYNANVVSADFVATIMFPMLGPHLSKVVINNTQNHGPYVAGNDGAPTQTNFNSHDSCLTTKRKKGKGFLSRREKGKTINCGPKESQT